MEISKGKGNSEQALGFASLCFQTGWTDKHLLIAPKYLYDPVHALQQ